MRVFETTTSTISIGWDHAEGPVQQYKIAYAPLTGDPITEFVSNSPQYLFYIFNYSLFQYCHSFDLQHEVNIKF